MSRRGIPANLLFAGILSTPAAQHRREIIRKSWLDPLMHGFSYAFVVGSGGSHSASTIAALHREQSLRSDVMLLTTTVDRNSTACPSTKCPPAKRWTFTQVGKTFDFFVTVASTLSQSFLWVAKMDDDVYLLQPNILGELLPLNRTDGYYGARCPVSAYGKYPSRGEWFMCGMFYAVTWDVVRLFHRNRARLPRFGKEDQVFKQTLAAYKRGCNTYYCGWTRCHDAAGAKARHGAEATGVGGSIEREPDLADIMVHQCKTDERWHALAAFFKQSNATNTPVRASTASRLSWC